MTRKDFTFVADRIRNEFDYAMDRSENEQASERDRYTAGVEANTLRMLAAKLADDMCEEYPRFNSSKFMAAAIGR